MKRLLFIAIAGVSSMVLFASAGFAGADSESTGDAARGEELFNVQCLACHNVMKGATPDLYGVVLPLHGIVGREAAQVAGFFYSKAMRESGVVWTKAELVRYLENPKEAIPGVRMEFPGLADEQSRWDVVEYIYSRQTEK